MAARRPLRAAVLVATALALLFPAPTARAASLPARPNIVLIVSDDHGYADFSRTGLSPDVATPHLDRLAAEGVVFEQGYVTAPICTPSRLGLLLGRHQQRHGTWAYRGPGVPDPGVPTLAEVLRGAGYATAHVGKIHYNIEFDATCRSHPLRHGFDYFYGFNGPAQHYLVHDAARWETFRARLAAHAPDNQGYPVMFYEPMWIDDRQEDVTGFSTHLFRDAALRFIDAHADQPFFLLLSFNAVHDQTYQLPPEYLAAHGIPPARDWDPAVESHADWTRDVYTEDLLRAYIRGQLHYLDEAIGSLLDHLDRTGLRRRTVVIYVSDNGGAHTNGSRNAPLRSGKFTLFEGGIRVPFMISWPAALPSGTSLPNVVSTLDLLPTAAALAGVPAPATAEGLDLVPLLTGDDPDRAHQTLVWDTGTRWAVRHGDWKLHFSTASNRAGDLDEGLGFHLTHLPTDPAEAHNLVEEQPAITAELTALHRRWLEDVLRPTP